MSYTFVFAAVTLLARPVEAMIVGALCALVQCNFKSKQRPILHRTLFSISSLMLSAYLSTCSYVYVKMLVAGGAANGGGIQTQLAGLVVATFTYFLVNTLSVSAAIGLSSGQNVLRTWHANFLWTGPSYFVGSTVAAILSILIQELGLSALLLALPPLALIYYSYRLYLGRIEDGQRHLKAIEELHIATIEALALAINAKDQTAHQHMQRVQTYAVGLAKALKLDENQIKAIKAASLLRDIGNLAVPEYILSKPGKLTQYEFQKVSMHTIVGHQILSTINFPYPVADIVLHHHEKWDGSGYPTGMKGEEIPIEARILGIVDGFDAMISDRPYRKGVSFEEAMMCVVSEGGRSFDPQIVSLFKELFVSLEADVQKAITDTDNASANQARAAIANNAATMPIGGLAVQNKVSVYEVIRAANKEISALYDLAQVVGTTLSLSETLSLISAKIKKILPTSTTAFYLLEGHELAPKHVEGIDEQVFSDVRIPLGSGISGWVAANRKSVINASPSLELKFLEDPAKFTYLQSAISIALIANEDVIGVITLYDLQPNKFTDDNLRLLEMVSSKVAVALKNSMLFEQTHEDALTDPITGLPNSRFLFMRLDQEISRARRHGSPLTVLAMDLDGFKQINDTRGHLIGDRVLINVGRMLKACLREYDFVARTGGDEFVALLVEMSAEDVAKKVDIIQKEIANLGLDQKNDALDLGISIGVSAYGEDGQDADTLLTKADSRMYKSKKARKESKILQPTTGAEDRNVVNFPRKK
jgi:diguanylate cyclase (GGDEF)-like protein